MLRLIVIAMFSAVLFSACSGASLKNEWKDQRGYSDSDIDQIMDKAKEYNKEKISGDLSSSRFNSAPSMEVDSRLKAIFCSCVKKVGAERCRTKAEGLSSEHKALWIKANAVDMALLMQHTALDAGPARKIDPDECN